MGSTTLTIRMDEQTKERLDSFARSLARSKSYIVTHAIEDYLEINEWQVGETVAGMREADTGMLVEHDKVKAKWEAKLAGSLDKRRGKKSGRD